MLQQAVHRTNGSTPNPQVLVQIWQDNQLHGGNGLLEQLMAEKSAVPEDMRSYIEHLNSNIGKL